MHDLTTKDHAVLELPHIEPATLRKLYRLEDEVASAITHGLGLALSIVALCVLLAIAVNEGTVWHVVGCSIYGGSLVALYLASTLYHSVWHRRCKAALRVIDHACIFLLIAGTYTPFTLTALRGAWGYLLLVLVWTFALVGIMYKLLRARSGLPESAIPYLIMGWLALIAAKPIVETIPVRGLLWLLAGGLAYTLGTIFYNLDGRRFYHAIWHLFVLAGSALHFCAVLFYTF
jgi:hemolysin III